MHRTISALSAKLDEVIGRQERTLSQITNMGQQVGQPNGQGQQQVGLIHLNEKRMDMKQETNYYMPYSEELDSCQEYQIWHQREVTWEQGPIRALELITLHRNLIFTIGWACPEHQFWAVSAY